MMQKKDQFSSRITRYVLSMSGAGNHVCRQLYKAIDILWPRISHTTRAFSLSSREKDNVSTCIKGLLAFPVH